MIIRPPHMEVRIKPGFWPDLAKMQKTIADAGYTPVPEQIELRVTGTVRREGDQKLLELDAMRTPLSLRLLAKNGDPGAADPVDRHIGEVVEVVGLWRPPGTGQAGTGEVTVTSVSVVNEKR